jgi:adenylate kinase
VILLLFGPPGCGKGTQAAYLAERFQIPAISTGEMFRAECKAGTELGRTACAGLNQGVFVNDQVVNDLVAGRIARPDCAPGFVLDGYPRTVPQAVAFASLLRERRLPEPVVIHLQVPDELLVMRLGMRRQCAACSRIYNLLSHPPRVHGVCDGDGCELIMREDDRESVIRDRLRVYHQQTGPVLRWYRSSRVRRVNGSMPPDHVARLVASAVMEADAGAGFARMAAGIRRPPAPRTL